MHLLSTFIKRRIGLPPSSRAPGLDQLPESLLAALASRRRASLTRTDVAAAVTGFVLADVLLSGWLHRAGLRERPY